MAKCGGCGKFISSADAAKCNKCNMLYHRGCVNLPNSGSISLSWQCPECTKNVMRDNQADTPIRGRSQFISSPTEIVCQDQIVHESNPLQEISKDFVHNIKLLNEELRTMRIEMQLFRENMAELRSTLKMCNDRIDGLSARVATLEQEKISPSAQVLELDKVIEELKRELQERDQELLANDLEIGNFPETSGENPVHTVGLIASKLGVVIDERDIVSATRVGGYYNNGSNGSDGAERRPRPLVVRLARRYVRDELLRSARVRRGATTEDMVNTTPPRRFYVNERLTKHNRQLFRQVREAANRHGWRYVWTKRGKILARKVPGDPSYTIRSEADILRVFGTQSEQRTSD